MKMHKLSANPKPRSNANHWTAQCRTALTVTDSALAGGANQASKMTSFSAGGTAADQPELFSLPADQMAHIQVVQVAQAPFERTVRLTGGYRVQQLC